MTIVQMRQEIEQILGTAHQHQWASLLRDGGAEFSHERLLFQGDSSPQYRVTIWRGELKVSSELYSTDAKAFVHAVHQFVRTSGDTPSPDAATRKVHAAVDRYLDRYAHGREYAKLLGETGGEFSQTQVRLPSGSLRYVARIDSPDGVFVSGRQLRMYDATYDVFAQYLAATNRIRKVNPDHPLTNGKPPQDAQKIVEDFFETPYQDIWVGAFLTLPAAAFTTLCRRTARGIEWAVEMQYEGQRSFERVWFDDPRDALLQAMVSFINTRPAKKTK